MSVFEITAILTAALLSTHLTYFLSHRTSMGVIRASSLPTLAFLAICHLLFAPDFATGLFACLAPLHATLPKLQAAFFGGAFVGMSHKSRLSEKRVLVASLVFGLAYCWISDFKGGIGGTLGATAFAACLVTQMLFPGSRLGEL